MPNQGTTVTEGLDVTCLFQVYVVNFIRLLPKKCFLSTLNLTSHAAPKTSNDQKFFMYFANFLLHDVHRRLKVPG